MADGMLGRLFLAAPLAPEVRDALTAHLREALGGAPLPGRVVPAENWHLTLRFLGDTTHEALERLRAELRAAPLGAPFTIAFGRCGAFPRPARATVLWLGVAAGEDPLRTLAERAETAAVAAGWNPERRPFSPHLTLSRIRPPADLRPLLERIPPFPDRLPVNELVLYRSHLGGGPVRYEALEYLPLTPLDDPGRSGE